MAKKTFDTNVALNWISTDISLASGKKNTSEEGKETVAKSPEDASIPEKQATEDEKIEQKHKPAKSSGVKIVLEKETKRHHTCLRLKSRTYEKIEKLAKDNGISVSNCINQILDQVVQ